MALKHGITFKSVNSNFEQCKTVLGNSQKVTSGKLSKKAKLESDDNAEDKHNESLEDLENLRNSYLLTMSQSMCENIGNEVEEQEKNEILFEPFTEVSICFYSKNI